MLEDGNWHAHPLYFLQKPHHFRYRCSQCNFDVDVKCATERLLKNIIHHPSHIHPLVCITKQILSECDACATGKTFKNYKDAEYPDLLHLPFPDPSYSILKHLFFKKNGPCTLEVPNDVTKTHDNISHQHSLVSSRIKSISFHDPMKRIELLCNGCLRPITTTPIYMCANEDDHCNFVLHEWCSRLPTELKDHHGHPEHTLILHSTVPGKFFGVFTCNICNLPCNGFVYYCGKCEYHIDVNCAFLPKEITHASHPNHLLSRVIQSDNTYYSCKICWKFLRDEKLSYSCHICDDFHLHPECALLIPETTTHKCDRHPMKLSYFPIENHKSEYFCEICEEEFDPEFPFYHCHKCMQSMHPACAPSILRFRQHQIDKVDADMKNNKKKDPSPSKVVVSHLICGIGLASSFWLAINVYSISLIENPVETLRLVWLIQVPVVILIYSFFREDKNQSSYLKAVARGLLGLPVGAVVNALGAIVLGAPVGTRYFQRTLNWSLVMSAFTFVPAASVYGSSWVDWHRIFADTKPNGFIDYMICVPAYGAVIGAWFGAWPMPLDWERMWQEWPICVTYGTIIGYLVGMLASFSFAVYHVSSQHVKGD
ncbi:hypothetical protein L1987_87223 [Smallanthus sonchifolius]|nr:hypothetical protein L1987_87223 [Smallanthus sonchifolius]